nr:SDR family oxidoreductase [Flavobacterium sp.]
MGNLKGKTAVITGGAGVLGTALSKALAQNGANVAILGRDFEKANRLADDINADGGSAIGISADVCSKESLQSAHKTINEKFGKIDILVNGAGGNHPGGISLDSQFDANSERSFFDLEESGIRHVFDLNFMGTLLPTQVFAKDMISRENCNIVNISSVSAMKPLTKVAAYSAAKAAISNFTQWLAVYFSKENIRVNAIVPGFFLTEQNRNLLTNPDGTFTDRGKKAIAQTPMQKFGEPENLVSTLLWLLDEQSNFITGITVPVDGGFTAFHGV